MQFCLLQFLSQQKREEDRDEGKEDEISKRLIRLAADAKARLTNISALLSSEAVQIL